MERRPLVHQAVCGRQSDIVPGKDLMLRTAQAGQMPRKLSAYDGLGAFLFVRDVRSYAANQGAR